MEAPSAKITSIFRIMNIPGRDQIVCPNNSCRYVRMLSNNEAEIIRKGEGFLVMASCEKCKYTFSLHEGLLQRKFLFYDGYATPKFPEERTIIPWNPFWDVMCTYRLPFKIGVTKRFDGHNIYENFSQVLDIVPYEKGTTKNIIIEARRITPTTFDIVSSSNDPRDLGQSAEFHLFIFGNTKGKRYHVWKELLGGAISLINKKAFNSSIIQSCAALDAFMGHFLNHKIIGKFVDGMKWSNRKVEREFFIPKRKDFISNTEIYCQIFQDILRIELKNTDCYKNYFGSNGKGHGIKKLTG